MVWSKFMTSESREEIIGCFFSRYPKFIQKFASKYAIKTHTRFSEVHEVGNLSEARRDAEATADLLTLSLQLEKDNFLLGPEITVFDFSIAAMLASILFHTPKTWLTVLAESYPVFPNYLARVSDRLGGFPFTQSKKTP